MITITLPFAWAKTIAVLLLVDMIMRGVELLDNVLERKMGRSE